LADFLITHLAKKDEGKAEKKQSQHTGVGKFLMAVAERVSVIFGFHELAVISGVGVRGYYQKLGYKMDKTGEGEYMVKSLVNAVHGINVEGEENEGFLPLNLFGHKFNISDLQIPLTRVAITRQFLPLPIFMDKDGKWSDPIPHHLLEPQVENLLCKNYAMFSYQKIQSELPKLIVVKSETQVGPIVTCPPSLYANALVSPPLLPSSMSFLGTYLLVGLLVVLIAVVVAVMMEG
jgi:hypothetical protein